MGYSLRFLVGLMTVELYLEKKRARFAAEFTPRQECPHCLRASSTCYCAGVKPFVPSTHFAILIHPNEVWRSIASGRMAHLCLTNSSFYEGRNFSHHAAVNALIADPANYPVVLSPGEHSADLSAMSVEKRALAFPAAKQLVVFLIDGTWSQATKIKRESQNLKPLPHVCFTPRAPSQFLVRKQPSSHCYSTIEAIHEFIELVEQPTHRHHDNMIEVFTSMVNQQIDFEIRHGRKATRGERLAEIHRTF